MTKISSSRGKWLGIAVYYAGGVTSAPLSRKSDVFGFEKRGEPTRRPSRDATGEPQAHH